MDAFMKAYGYLVEAAIMIFFFAVAISQLKKGLAALEKRRIMLRWWRVD